MVFLLLGVIALPAAAFDIKPGEWEVEMKMSGMPSGIVIPKMKVCVTPERAKTGYMEKEPPENCKVKIIESKSNLVSYEVVCDVDGSKGKVTGTSKKISDNEVVLDVSTTIDEGDRKETIQTTARQKYIGPTCSKEAMQ
jgi:hypothetical protein